MEMWDQNFIDMETEDHFTFEKDEIGYFQFGLVQGRIDYRIEKVGEIERLEFSWEGQDENQQRRNGRIVGWAAMSEVLKKGFTPYEKEDNGVTSR